MTTGLSSLNDGRIAANHYSLADDIFEIPFHKLNYIVKDRILYFWNRSFSCMFSLKCDSDIGRLNTVRANGFYPFFKTVKEEEKKQEVYEQFFLPFHQNLKTNGELWSVFKKKLSILAKSYPYILIVFPPFPQFFKMFIDQKGLLVFNEQINDEIKKYPNVFFFNLIDGFSYKDKFYSDMVHFNEKGANKFTKDFINYINNSDIGITF